MDRRGREPVLNAPLPALLVALSIPAIYFLQSQVVDTDSLFRNYGLTPYIVEQGDYVGLFTSLILHGNWAHALMNAAFALAFGVPVASLLGNRLHHAIAYILFYRVHSLLYSLWGRCERHLRRPAPRLDYAPDRGVRRGFGPDGRGCAAH